MEFTLPALKGSEKQVSWSVKIRQTLLESVNSKLAENRVIDFQNMTGEIAQAINGFVNKMTTAKWWIENREMSSDCLIAIALRMLKLIKPGEAFRVRNTYREKTKQGEEWVTTRKTENNNWVLPIKFSNPLTPEVAKKVFVIEQWSPTNLESVKATTTKEEETESQRIYTLGECFSKSKTSMRGWASRDLVFCVLKYIFTYPPTAAPCLYCYGLTR